MSAPNRLRMLNHYFFDELGFHPNRATTTAPTTVICIASSSGAPVFRYRWQCSTSRSAARSGSSCRASGSPGHFLVKAQCGDGLLFIDVFARGLSLSAADLRHRLDQVLRGTKAPLEAYLRVASEREILARMLHNLKAIHADGEQWDALLEVQSRLIACCPTAPKSAATAGWSTRSSSARARRPATWPRISGWSPAPTTARTSSNGSGKLERAAAALN